MNIRRALTTAALVAAAGTANAQVPYAKTPSLVEPTIPDLTEYVTEKTKPIIRGMTRAQYSAAVSIFSQKRTHCQVKFGWANPDAFNKRCIEELIIPLEMRHNY